MTKQEKIREYFESGLCLDLSQEFCSGCNFTRKDGNYCEGVKERVGKTLKELSDLGVVIKADKELPESPYGGEDGAYLYYTELIGAGILVATEPLVEQE